MLRGLSTVSFYATEVSAAADWYSRLLGTAPYFTRDAGDRLVYAEFRLGDHQHELGIIDRAFAPAGLGAQPGGALAYWHVDDVAAAVARLVELGATVLEEPVERGPGFVTASVIDPFGNVLAVMYNQHYLDMLTTRSASTP